MDPNANWWQFSIDPRERGAKILDGPGGLREVNPELPGGRHALDYRTYLGLDGLLNSQVPGSRNSGADAAQPARRRVRVPPTSAAS